MIGLSKKRKISSVPFIIIAVILLFIGAIPSMIHSRNKKNFNLCYNLGEEAMSDGRYNDAVLYYSKAIKYNDNVELVLKIETASRLAKSSFYFDKGLLDFYNGNYTEAIESFERVSKQDEERLAVASQKISLCKAKCTEKLILSAKEQANESSFEAAIVFLDEAISIDASNTEAIALKTQYLADIQRIADEEAKRKLMEEKKASQTGQTNDNQNVDNTEESTPQEETSTP